MLLISNTSHFSDVLLGFLTSRFLLGITPYYENNTQEEEEEVALKDERVINILS